VSLEPSCRVACGEAIAKWEPLIPAVKSRAERAQRRHATPLTVDVGCHAHGFEWACLRIVGRISQRVIVLAAPATPSHEFLGPKLRLGPQSLEAPASILVAPDDWLQVPLSEAGASGKCGPKQSLGPRQRGRTSCAAFQTLPRSSPVRRRISLFQTPGCRSPVIATIDCAQGGTNAALPRYALARGTRALGQSLTLCDFAQLSYSADFMNSAKAGEPFMPPNLTPCDSACLSHLSVSAKLCRRSERSIRA
jgi:hypothetical protein